MVEQVGIDPFATTAPLAATDAAALDRPDAPSTTQRT